MPPRPEARRAAFERLAWEHAPALYGAALRMARSPDDAQDLTQETLVRAYAAFDRFERGSNFRAWLLRILTNAYISRCRRGQRVRFEPLEEAETPEFRSVAGERPLRGEPEHALMAGVLDEEIEAALAGLSEGVRLVVLLVDVEGLPYEEAAAALGVPVGTVRSRLNRGREQLRQALATYARERRLVPRAG